MKKLILFSLVLILFTEIIPYEKKSIVERFTNCSCGPCASINNSWYNATTSGLLSTGQITHVIYNVDWPSATDPMHIFNAADNNTRRGYYGVNSVPWIEINGINCPTSQANFTSAVSTGNSEFAPFKIVLTPERFSNNVLNVKVKILRDPTDVTVFTNTRLRLALTEKWVPLTCASCCNNGETEFFSVTRKMLPDAKGTAFDIPAPGDSVEIEFLYIPTEAFINEVNFDSITAVAFIQEDGGAKTIYQSEDENFVLADRINSAFRVQETLGAVPFAVTFEDFSSATSTTNLTSWAWDFDNDGTIDSQDPEPSWNYTEAGAYSVSLTVSDGQSQHTRLLKDYINVIDNASHILVVNGIEYPTYPFEMADFYNNSAGFGNHEVDVWDVFGDQGFDYSANPNIKNINLFNQKIPNSVLDLYENVIWFGNNYGGDLVFYDPQQVLDFVQNGGSFLLATRLGTNFLSSDLMLYTGVLQVLGDATISTPLIAKDENLIDMPVTTTAANSLVHFVVLDQASSAIPIFDEDTTTTQIAGFRIRKDDDGAFIYIAGRPYRFDNAASYQNYDTIINRWMNPPPPPSGTGDDLNSGKPDKYNLYANYPNPFNPVTTIKYSIPERNFVTLKVFDILGNEVASLVNTEKEPGNYSISFGAENLSSGIYIYKLQAGNFIDAKKMILMK